MVFEWPPLAYCSYQVSCKFVSYQEMSCSSSKLAAYVSSTLSGIFGM